eukprot:Skav202423  [mRNA]  locus=scaffold1370:405080:405505:- [translate_table: standard]
MTTSTAQACARWENCQETLRMAASALPNEQMLDRALLSKWSLILFVCWEVSVQGRLPEVGSLERPHADSLHLRCHVTEEESQLFRLQGIRLLLQKEFIDAILDLGKLKSHVDEANWVLESAEIAKIQELLEEVSSKFAPAT